VEWVLCDGNNGTPDLQGSFVPGAGDSYAVDETGGAAGHNHTFTGDGHDHDIGGGTGLQAGVGFDNTTSAAPLTGTVDNFGTNAKHMRLAYIQFTG